MTTESTSTLVRLRLYTRNARLIDARRELGWTQSDAARWSGIKLTRLSEIENLKIVPTELEMDDLSGVLLKPVEYLFPKILKEAVQANVFNRREVELSEDQVYLLESRVPKPVPQTTSGVIERVERDADLALLKQEVSSILETLTPREQRVIESRFGLTDGVSRTLDDIGEEFEVTGETIRKVEEKALRKLRHRTRSRRLKPYID